MCLSTCINNGSMCQLTYAHPIYPITLPHAPGRLGRVNHSDHKCGLAPRPHIPQDPHPHIYPRRCGLASRPIYPRILTLPIPQKMRTCTPPSLYHRIPTIPHAQGKHRWSGYVYNMAPQGDNTHTIITLIATSLKYKEH